MEGSVDSLVINIDGKYLPGISTEDLAIILGRARSWMQPNCDTLPESIITTARELVGTPWPTTRAANLVELHMTGNRATYEEQVFAKQERLTIMSLAAAATGEKRFLDEVTDGVILLCEQISWCWPAHDDSFQKKGWLIPDIDSPFLDLGASEVAAQLAIVSMLLGHKLPQGVDQLIRSKINERIFVPFLTRDDWHWLGIKTKPHNWCAWIHSNLLIAALALADENNLDVAWRSLEGIARFLDNVPQDGSVDEGVGYWWAGVGRSLGALEWLSLASAGRINAIPKHSKIQKSMLFPLYTWLGDNRFLSFADSSSLLHDPAPWGMLTRLSSDENLRNLGRQLDSGINPSVGLARVMPEFLNTSPQCSTRNWPQPQPKPPALVVLPDLQLMIARAKGVTVSLKGGHNGENHNHNDVGSLTYTLEGKPVLVDPGRVSYTAQSFGSDRYNCWAYQSCWHCLPRLANQDQQPGADHKAKNFLVEESSIQFRGRIDLADAYSMEDQESWQRCLTLDRTDGALQVEESWTSGISSVTGPDIFFVVAGQADIISAQKVRLCGEYGVIELYATAGEFTKEMKRLDDPIMQENWGKTLTRLRLTSLKGRQKVEWILRRSS